MYFIIVISDKS